MELIDIFFFCLQTVTIRVSIMDLESCLFADFDRKLTFELVFSLLTFCACELIVAWIGFDCES